MRRVWFAIGILLLAAALFSAGLVRKLASLRGTGRTAERVITVIPKTMESPWWNQVRLGALTGVQGTPYRMVWNGPALESDHISQIISLEHALARRSAAVVIAPNDSQALNRPVAEAAAQIPCVLIDSPLMETGQLPLVATDNYRAGELAARILAKSIDGRGRILVINHLRNSKSTGERARGFAAAMADDYPEIRVVQSSCAETSLMDYRAQTVELLARHPDAVGVFAANLETSEGAYKALKSEKRAGEISFVAFDSSAQLVGGVANGEIGALIVQNPFEIGRRGVQRAIEALENRQGESFSPIPVFVVTRRNLERMKRKFPAALGL
ncbi:substrate-binding domain-containing protein [uncultured Victivallis sp.]|uniref:substrate-binding domain-containing protein n=1 Tax=uncultured Victivallis sp. TaxID=354118 RepID=UPI0025E9689F|nr:substrate-binding domain-containing protein [uncultured Victivallis sp.]